MIFALAAPAVSADEPAAVKAGFIFLHDETSTYDLNFINGAKEACEKLGVEYIFKTNIPEGQEAADAAEELIDEGCNFIFADSFGHESFLMQVAKDYPEVQFCHATGTQAHTAGLDNYHNGFASIYEGRFLGGVAAGLKLNEMIESGAITADQAKAFAGCDVLASAAGMDKAVMKTLFRAAGLPVLDAIRVSEAAWRADPDAVLAEAAEKLSMPVIVKPVDLGSSVGITIAREEGALRAALDEAFLFSDAALVEKALVDPREINCAVLGNADEARASECEEPVSGGDILSYEDKYVSGGKGGKGMSGAKRLIPAPIAPELREKIRAYAVSAFAALGCEGVARVDFLLDGDEVFVNEINTIPGSLAFYLFEPDGMKYPELLDELIRLALVRERRRARRSTSIDTGILKNYKGGSKLRK
jgi:D-alanine--D-alanine ligase